MRVAIIVASLIYLLINPNIVYAQNSYPEIQTFTTQALNTISIIASLAAVFFLIKGGYLYITSTGKPEALESAKKTIRNALIGLVLILSANVFVSLLTTSLSSGSPVSDQVQYTLEPLEAAEPPDGLTMVLTEAIAGFLQSIIQSAVQPLVNGLITFLTTTPSVVSNETIYDFWLIILGITNTLFALVIALVGLHIMSASTLGFEEVELKQILPRIGLAFLLANMSIYLIDWVIKSCNVLVETVLNATGGLNQVFLTDAFNPDTFSILDAALITLIFGVLFIVLVVVLLLFYISRLIMIALGAVLSPLIFLLWALPKTTDFAEISAKTYIITIYSVFVHVVIIQLAASFLTFPGEAGTSTLLSVLIGIGLLFTLLKSQSMMYQLVFYNTGKNVIKKVGSQIVNVINTSHTEESTSTSSNQPAKTPRKAVNV